jgi:hypothetical protein
MGHNLHNGFIEVFSTTRTKDTSYPLTADELDPSSPPGRYRGSPTKAA